MFGYKENVEIFSLFFYLLNILDILSTYIGIYWYNFNEVNPIFLFLIKNLGFYGAALIKIYLGMLMINFIINNTENKYISVRISAFLGLIIVDIVFYAVCFNNFYLILNH